MFLRTPWKRGRGQGVRQAAGACLALAVFALWAAPGALRAQNPSSAQNPYFGSVTTAKPAGGTLQLSLDDAMRMGIAHNLALTEAREREKTAKAETLLSLQPLLPTVTAGAETGAHKVNLAAQGFTPSVFSKFAAMMPGLQPINPIVRMDVTRAQVNYSQTLFSMTDVDRYRAAKATARAAYYSRESSRGLVVLNVGNAYLAALAAGAQVDTARALERADRTLLDQTEAEHAAGVAAHLDVLRAQVQYQSQRQSVIAAENGFAKAKILLNREIGLPPEQAIQLTDAVPYAGLGEIALPEAREMAYRNRQDYQGLKAQVRASTLSVRAAKRERWPTLSFNGNYGVTGLTRGFYHGTFVAAGSLRLPVFDEARFRGDRQTAEAGLNGAVAELADLRQKIEQQLRDSMLDVDANGRLVRVAQSNVKLARAELDQTRERFAAGIDDNLPVVEAQATLAGAESNLIGATMQYNQSKLALARSLGIIDTQYGTYLHGGSPAASH